MGYDTPPCWFWGEGRVLLILPNTGQLFLLLPDKTCETGGLEIMVCRVSGFCVAGERVLGLPVCPV